VIGEFLKDTKNEEKNEKKEKYDSLFIVFCLRESSYLG
jgi:hypothetical protein